jgi:acetoin utilization deacetylase AcuC-like enzyme
MLGLPTVWSDDCLRHEAPGEVWVGVPGPGDELPARAKAIRDAVRAAGSPIVNAKPHDDAALLAVHDAALVDFLRDAWDGWSAAGLPEDPGQDRVVPYIFAHRELIGDRTPLVPAAPWARTGFFCFDTMTLIGPGTWPAVRAAVDVALTAVELVATGTPLAYACCRPPGHHALRSAYGGSCYLNNAAIAAEALRWAVGGPVAIVDIDAHHGNGAQEIFAARVDVLTASVHVDPAAGWFPHFLGLAGETDDANLNVPVRPGAGDDEWLRAVSEAAAFALSARALVVALGVDAAAGDPNSPLQVTDAGYHEAGRLLGALGLPTVVVQEGGYDLDTIGRLVVRTLEGLEEGRTSP